MVKVVYEIVEHDGGWAYRSDGVYSEAFANRDDALAAAKTAAKEQRAPGEPVEISFEDERGRWHTEQSDGQDRPETEVEG
ncbi:MAG TPA: DUF2188 domain-containing protein [Methylomirabilota bacterium]|nr:DUF2188 domain-containing protein [Methylomirabilota bacterium]